MEHKLSDVKFSIFSQNPFIDLNIYQYGYEKCKPLHSYGPSIRNHYLFHFIISGKGLLVSQNSKGKDEKYNLSEGNGFLILPDQVNTYIADGDEPWEYTWIEFDGLIVEEALKTAGLTIDSPIFKTNDPIIIKDIQDVLLDIVDIKENYPYKQIGKLYTFLHYLTMEKPPRPKTSSSERISDYYIKELTKFIEHHYNEDITIEDIANYLNLSRGHVNKIFKKYTGQTPKEFLTSYRMINATKLLRTTKLPIGKIGSMIGYKNQLHFSRAFKNHFGVSPKIWRQINKED